MGDAEADQALRSDQGRSVLFLIKKGWEPAFCAAGTIYRPDGDLNRADCTAVCHRS